MSSQRESLIADLITETGLPDAEIRQVLNALAVRMNEEFRSSSEFELPGVGKLMRPPEISLRTDMRGGMTAAEIDSLLQRRGPTGSGMNPIRIPAPEQSTGQPPAIAEVVEDAEVPLRRREL